MAGNIIPAIATTNAIVAGLVVMKALAVLKNKSKLNQSFLRASTNWPMKDGAPDPQNPECPVCNDVYIPFKVDLEKCTLGDFANDVVQGWLKPAVAGDDDFEAEITEAGRILADPDFEDNFPKTLAELGVKRGQYLTVDDLDGVYRRVHFCVAAADGESQKPFTLPEQVPEVPKRAPPQAALSEASEDEIVMRAVTPPPTSGTKRSAPDDEEAGPSNGSVKKRKMGAGAEDAIEIE